MKPDEKDWKPFQIKAIADVHSGHDIYAQERIDGVTPLITAVGTNNGIGYFVGNENDSRAEKSISVVRNGASVGKAFYHKYSALFGNDCRRMKLKYSDSELINLFVAQAIGMQNKAFSYSRKLGTERLMNLNIMLPVTDSGEPDYEYMAEYVQECRKAMLVKYRTYVEARISELGDYVEIPALKEKRWDAVRLVDIFDTVSRGKRLKKADHVEGDTPYVSSTAFNNGNDGTCGNDTDVRVFENCLTLANSGSVGSCFYHPYRFVASDHVTALRRTGLSANTYLALSALISRLGEKYNFNREINDIRISRERIMIPVTDSGEPDYKYMEQYAKNMMLRKYKQYLDFLERT